MVYGLQERWSGRARVKALSAAADQMHGDLCHPTAARPLTMALGRRG